MLYKNTLPGICIKYLWVYSPLADNTAQATFSRQVVLKARLSNLRNLCWLIPERWLPCRFQTFRYNHFSHTLRAPFITDRWTSWNRNHRIQGLSQSNRLDHHIPSFRSLPRLQYNQTRHIWEQNFLEEPIPRSRPIVLGGNVIVRQNVRKHESDFVGGHVPAGADHAKGCVSVRIRVKY